MLNLRARQYEPVINRFSQKDFYPSNPLAALSFNPYLFTYNSPVNMVDSDGLNPSALNNLLSSIGNTVKKAANTAGRVVKKAATAIAGEKVVNSGVSHVKSAVSVVKKLHTIANAIFAGTTDAHRLSVFYDVGIQIGANSAHNDVVQ